MSRDGAWERMPVVAGASKRRRGPLGKSIARTGISLLALAAAGCRVGPDYRRPVSPLTPLGWFSNRPPLTAASQPVAKPADIAWWESFRDTELTSLAQRDGPQH